MQSFIWPEQKKYINGIYYNDEDDKVFNKQAFNYDGLYSKDNIKIFKEESSTNIPNPQNLNDIGDFIRSKYINDLSFCDFDDRFKKGIYDRNLIFNRNNINTTIDFIPKRKRSPLKNIVLLKEELKMTPNIPPKLPKNTTRQEIPKKSYKISKILIDS